MALSHPSKATVEEVIDDWPEKTRETAETLRDEYGEPHEATPNRLIWHDNAPWKRTVLHRDGPTHQFPIPHADYLEQYIDYQVPNEMFDDLAQYDGSVHADRTRGELGASCHTEGANFLSLNLAHDVVTGEKTVDEAREDYAAIMAKGKAGGSPEYMQGLQFPLPEGDQRDPDVTILTEEIEHNARKVGLAALAGLVLGGVSYYVASRRRDRES